MCRSDAFSHPLENCTSRSDNQALLRRSGDAKKKHAPGAQQSARMPFPEALEAHMVKMLPLSKVALLGAPRLSSPDSKVERSTSTIGAISPRGGPAEAAQTARREAPRHLRFVEK